MLLFVLLCGSASARQDVVSIGKFSEKSLVGWQERQFYAKTHYSLNKDGQKGWVIQARSENSASGLMRKIEVDLRETPYLNWSWRVDKLPEVKDVKTKEGDDYSARIFVIFKSGAWFWNTKALNYVWGSSYLPGENGPNVFAASSQMMVLRPSSSPLKQWVTEKRNIQKDIFNCFGIEQANIEAVAIMTDSDNSGSSAVAYYGDIFFTSE
jgi:hypothetical protein